METKRKGIDPGRVITRWVCPNSIDDVDVLYEDSCQEDPVEVDVTFFEENGTPMCECGEDMTMTGVDLVVDVEPFRVVASGWRIEDIQSLFDVTDEEAKEFMERNAKYFDERMTEEGWEAWKIYGGMDGLKPKEEE